MTEESSKDKPIVVQNGHVETEKEQKPAEACEDVVLQFKVVSPGGDVVNLSVNTNELVQEIHRVLVDREETCHRTCFSLQHESQILDLFTELKTVENLKDGSEIRVVEERYNQREAKTHIRHIYDLLHSLDLRDCYLGRDQMSLSFLPAVLEGDNNEANGAKTKQMFDRSTLRPPEFLIPTLTTQPQEGSPQQPQQTSIPLLPLHPVDRDLKPIHCLKQINYSNWNPPHSQRKMAGDLLYVLVHTLEDKRIHITACPRGFFINQSTEEVFSYKPVPGYPLCHSLADLLKKFSPGFKRNFEAILKKRASRNPLERVPCPYQKFSWLSPILPHESDFIRKEEAFSTRLASDENLPGQPRDWNEELQMSRELPKSTINERLLRDRSIFKTNSDFIAASTRAAISVVNGDILAINPGEMKKQQMYIWNNMFFSYGFDIKDHYKDFGGEGAAHVATASDLNGVRAYSLLDQNDLHTLGTAIIDYRGYRVTAQTIIPGILDKEQEKLVVYGSIDFGKTVVSHPKYEEALEKCTKQLKVRPHEVVNSAGETIKLYSSVDCKGIIGNDNRAYILDLLRTFPPDLNFMGSQVESHKPQLPKTLTDLGYPYSHSHLMSTLRQELVEAFADAKYEVFLKTALKEYSRLTKDENQTAVKSEEESSEQASAKSEILQQFVNSTNMVKDMQNMETAPVHVKEAAALGAKVVGSLKDDKCEILFNPDVFHQFVQFPVDQNESIEKDKDMLFRACEFLVLEQIPKLASDIANHALTLYDGRGLVDAMHQRGINVRYLNRLIDNIGRDRVEVQYARKICLTELFVRSAKHLFRNYIQDVDCMLTSAAVSHFLNCLITNCANLNPLAGVDEYVIKMANVSNGSGPGQTAGGGHKQNSKNKKKKRMLNTDAEEMVWSTESASSIWHSLVQEAADYYHYTIDAQSIDHWLQQESLSRLSLLRGFCLTVGIQLNLREYNLNQVHHSKPVFNLDDVINLFPVVKHLHPIASDAYQYYSTGQSRISSGMIQEGLALITEASELLSAVYGAMHPDTGACSRLLARLYYILGEHQSALIFQQRAVMIAERVHGIDSPNVASEYLHLAVYSFACGQLSAALNCLYRARHICLVCCGDEHPEIAQVDTNIGLMLLVVEEFDLSALFLENARRLNRLFFGAQSLKEAFSCHLVSRTHVYRGDYRKALEFEKLRHGIYLERLGLDNECTVDSDECMKLLLNQAVSIARKAQQIQQQQGSGKQVPALETAPVSKKAAQPIAAAPVKPSGDDAKILSSQLASVNLNSSAVTSAAGSSSSPFVMAGGAGAMFQYPNLVTILETINRVNGIFVIQIQQNKGKDQDLQDQDVD